MDDILALFRKGSMHQPVGLIVALLTALQAPISWKKAQLGPSVTWCGWTFCFRTETVALVQSKLEKLRQQLQKLSKGSKVAKKDLEACLGLLNWATTLSPHMRSFMSCLYKDLRSLASTSTPNLPPPQRRTQRPTLRGWCHQDLQQSRCAARATLAQAPPVGPSC